MHNRINNIELWLSFKLGDARRFIGGIWTFDSFKNYASFQDQNHKPLGHFSHKYVFISHMRLGEKSWYVMLVDRFLALPSFIPFSINKASNFLNIFRKPTFYACTIALFVTILTQEYCALVKTSNGIQGDFPCSKV